MTDAIPVTDYDSLTATDLYDREKAILIQYLSDNPKTTVIYLAEWLVDDKDLESIDGTNQLFSGEVTRETSKAIYVNQSSRKEWLPKSQIELFERASGFTGEMPQRGLTDYE